MECEFTSESLRFIVTSLGAGLVLGGIFGFVIGFWRAIVNHRKRRNRDEIGTELSDTVKPIPEHSVIYGRCGPQPPSFIEGSETLCPECRAEFKETGEMAYCARLFPIAYTWRD